eukprot:TRINITY_DN33446_c0_g1_i1.p1 TRINITY_DN33446_c0_g1~~TRINITY_DN33446_c0_g1_i1.p1  ORF type:complete len:1000 (+),score=129.26 TRINITY_DN33446_c0_g1_i1:88-3000(+)
MAHSGFSEGSGFHSESDHVGLNTNKTPSSKHRRPSLSHAVITFSKKSVGACEIVSRRLASSGPFSAFTTVLTIYALFGDDMRLLLTAKPSDPIFDFITILSMVIFSIEIVALSIGKSGYFLDILFWLDVLSTVTLVLDVTTLNEDIFGDQISKRIESGKDAGHREGNAQAGESAEAARAARMSRMGTKAGRVVRLIRIVRLLRFIRIFKKQHRAEYENKDTDAAPGDEYDTPEDDQSNEKESVVSKKLSEMTTRRVIMLVLIIMFLLPFFQPENYIDKLPTSAQYGMNVLYRSWIDASRNHNPWSSPAALQRYLNSTERRMYEDNFLQYVYYHNHNSFCADSLPAGVAERNTPLGSFGRLFWIGMGIQNPVKPTKSDETFGKYFVPGVAADYDWNKRWNGDDWDFYQCNLPAEVIDRVKNMWSNSKSCVKNFFRGISFVVGQEPDVVCPEHLRYQERFVIFPTLATRKELDVENFLFVFDLRAGSAMGAALNTAQTCFICFLLGFGAMTFSNDANKLVLMPIERMIAKLDKIRNNPLEAMSIGYEEQHREQVVAERRNRGALRAVDAAAMHQQLIEGHSWSRRARVWLRKVCTKASAVADPMETVVLEKTIIKIGSLLALGLGEAGAEIIGQNMKGSSTSELNAMIPGRKVEAIFGFCDIRNFTDATEVLQDQVMVFVNRIANVVHSCINEFFGSPNKNIGDAFLLVWRLSGQPLDKQQRLADMSLICFVKIMARINRSPLLAEYRNHPKLVKRLPNYRVRMGFGLHSGWAIEGAIGSEFKIDASYLSPNVNIASRLEAMTKQYGCLILLSMALHTLMSELIASECRLIDFVLLCGTRDPFKLYTIDLDDLVLEVDRSAAVRKSERFCKRQEIQRLKNERWSEDYKLHRFFRTDVDIVTMRNKFSCEFWCRFNMAYLNYEAGEWQHAKDLLESTRFLLATEDGPSAALLRYIKQHNFISPKTWPGYRVLI